MQETFISHSCVIPMFYGVRLNILYCDNFFEFISTQFVRDFYLRCPRVQKRSPQFIQDLFVQLTDKSSNAVLMDAFAILIMFT